MHLNLAFGRELRTVHRSRPNADRRTDGWDLRYLAVGVAGAILSALIVDWVGLPIAGLLVTFGAAILGAVALLSILTLLRR